MLPLKPQRYDDQRDDIRPAVSLREAMNQLFNESFWDPFEDRSMMSNRLEFPRVDISETDKEVKVVANVPGIDPDKLSIEADEDSLTLSGQIERQDEKQDEKQYRFEREYGEFHRDILLPARVDPDQVSAASKNGVVTIRLPKVEESSGKKKVEVKSE